MRIRTAAWLLAAALAGAAVSAAANETLRVDNPWARATPPGVTVAAAYLTLDNRGRKADRLVGASSPRAARVEVHTIVHEGDFAKMRRVDPVRVAADERLTLEPGGMHIMLLGLTAPLVAGERVPLVLRFELAGEIRAEAIVLASGDSGKEHQHH